MKLDIERLRKELISVYRDYIKDRNDQKTITKAKKLFLEYSRMNILFPEYIADALNGLIYLEIFIKHEQDTDDSFFKEVIDNLENKRLLNRSIKSSEK